MCCGCLFSLSVQRINMSIAIVDMVNWTVVDEKRDCPCSPTKNYTTLIREEVGLFSHFCKVKQCILDAL